MNTTNTTQKGDELELKVFEIINELLNKEEFFISGKNSQIFRKKKYKSNKTNNEIIVDISIETFLPNAKHYSQLTVIECKNYQSTISVDKIRVLRSVMDEIGAHKGIIASRTKFQKGVLDLARANNVGLCLINTKNQFDWINYRIDKTFNHYTLDMIDNLLSTCSNKSFFAYSNCNCFENLPDLLIHLGVLDRFENIQEFVKIPYRSEEEINSEIEQLPIYIYRNDKLCIEELINFLREKYKVDFIFDTNLDMYNQQKILGKISFNPVRIFIDSKLIEDDYRWRFTFAHEVGHLILHSKLLKEFIRDNYDNEQTVFQSEVSDKINKRMELQANMFASKLLLPIIPLRCLIKEYFIKERIHKNFLYLDNQPCNRLLAMNLLYEIQCKFGVSIEAGKIRLKNIGSLMDMTEQSM